MANEVIITVIGNLTADPEFKEIGGKPVANFSIAHTARVWDRQANDWKDGEPTFYNASVWRDLAVNMKNSGCYKKGTRVIAQGSLRTTKKDDRTFINLDVTEIGPSTRFATIPQIEKATRGGNNGGFNSNNNGGQSTDGWGDSSSSTQDTDGWGTSSSDSNESPF